MIIAAVTHDAGWRERSALRVGRLAELMLDVDDQLVDTDTKIADATIVLERYDDPLEHSLIEACKRDDDASRMVYADWLEQHGAVERAEFVRAQAVILRHPPGDPAHAPLARRMVELIPALPYGWHRHLDRPVIRLGDRTRYAFWIGLPDSQMRMFKIFHCDGELTIHDDTVYVPQFSYSLERERDRVHPLIDASRSDVENHQLAPDANRWMAWGPTTDAVSSFIFRDGDELVITAQFYRPENAPIATTRIAASELAAMLETAIEVLG